MAGEPTIQQQDDRQVPLRGDAQGMAFGEMPPAAYEGAPAPHSAASSYPAGYSGGAEGIGGASLPATAAPEVAPLPAFDSPVAPSSAAESVAAVSQPAAEPVAGPQVATPMPEAEPVATPSADFAAAPDQAYAASGYVVESAGIQGAASAYDPAYAAGVAPAEPVAAPASAYMAESAYAAGAAYAADPAAVYGYAAAPVAPLDAVQPYAQPAQPAQSPIQVRTITVRTGRLVCDIEIHDVKYRYTTPRLSAFANGQYPDLPHHACVNDLGNTFGYVMEKTSVAHLLEHVTISEQVRNQASGSATFVGTTEWIDEAAGLARVEVGFKDDLVALRAFNEATRFLNMAVLTCLV